MGGLTRLYAELFVHRDVSAVRFALIRSFVSLGSFVDAPGEARVILIF